MMRDYDDDFDFEGDPYVVIERHDHKVVPFLLGLAVGAGAALLFAPRSGSETRQMIGSRARAAGDAARRLADEMADTVTSTIAETRDRVLDQVEAATATVRRRRDELVDAFDVGRSTLRDARTELEQRIAEQKQAQRQARREGQAS